jgi:Fe-S-cluster containining protein
MSGPLASLRISVDCAKCLKKCCSQPHDHVYLTRREEERLARRSGQAPEDFVVRVRNPHTGFEFRTLQLPCRFYEASTGRCGVYEDRPLVCRLYPFYLDPASAGVILDPGPCRENYRAGDPGGWTVGEHEAETARWFRELWEEADA